MQSKAENNINAKNLIPAPSTRTILPSRPRAERMRNEFVAGGWMEGFRADYPLDRP
jgi:hypothetical protein